MIQFINSPFGDNNLDYLTYDERKFGEYVKRSANTLPVISIFSIRFRFNVSLGFFFVSFLGFVTNKRSGMQEFLGVAMI